MDERWHCEIRPSEKSDSAGALAAIEKHLKELQTHTFKLLEHPR